MIRDCAVIAIDGTHASGKSTLVHALTAHYRRSGINAAAMPEPARTSPYIEDIVLRGRGEFDIAAEVDVFAAHLQEQLRTARNHQLLIADKTVLNVLAYAKLLLPVETSFETTVLEAMKTFCRAWVPTYDLVFLTDDRYQQPSDLFRTKVAGLQDHAARQLRDLYDELNVDTQTIPLMLDTHERVAWIDQCVTAMRLIRTR